MSLSIYHTGKESSVSTFSYTCLHRTSRKVYAFTPANEYTKHSAPAEPPMPPLLPVRAYQYVLNLSFLESGYSQFL